MGFWGMEILSAYAATDSYGTTIQKTITNNTSTGVEFRIDWGSSGSILSGFVLEDLFTPNLSFLSKSDSSLLAITNFSSGPTALRWTFDTNITPGTSGSIFLNFAKSGTGQFTNTGHIYGGEYSCDVVNNENTVNANFTVESAPFSAPVTDLMIDKKEGSCNPTSGILSGGSFSSEGTGMLSWFQWALNWNCTNTQPLSRYKLGDTVYYTLYVHNYGPNPVTQIAVADRFTNDALELVSVSGTYFGSRSHVVGSNLITWTNGFSLGANKGAYITLRFQVIADEYSPIDNEAKTRIMEAGPSQNTWGIINNTYDSLTYPNDTNWSNNSDSVQITVRSYDLAIEKSLISGTENPGNTVVYRLNFSNTGIARTDIMIRDLFTFSGVKFQSWAGSPGLIVDTPPTFTPGTNFGVQHWQGIHLGANASGYIDITVQLPTLVLWCINPPTFRNLAAIGTDQGIPGESTGVHINLNDINITNNNDTFTINTLPSTEGVNCGTINAPYDLRITKTADKTVVTEGDTVTYTLDVYNSGQSDKFVYLSDSFTKGMIFDSIVVDPSRYIKWRTNNNLRNDVMASASAPDNSIYRSATPYSKKSWLFNINSFVFDTINKDIYDIVSGSVTGLTACQTLFATGSMYQTSFAGVMSRFATRDSSYSTNIGLGMSVPQAIATTMADVYKSIWIYTQNQVNANVRNNSTIASQANNCGYYVGYEYALSQGYSTTEAQDRGDIVAEDMSMYMSNINNILNDNYINILDARLKMVGYLPHVALSQLFPLYTNSGQVWDEVHTLYQYPADTYVDLWQGNTNVRGPSYVISGTDIGYTTYDYKNITNDNFGDFIATPHGSWFYTIPLYTASTVIDNTHNVIYFQTGDTKNFFYVPANQNIQFKYKMIVGNGYNTGDIISNSATIAMCTNSNCTPGNFVYSSEIIPGANNSSTYNLTYIDANTHYDLSGSNIVSTPNSISLGSPVSYTATYCNKGTDTVSDATITYEYDSRLTYVSSTWGNLGTPTNDSINHLLNWPGTTSLALNECETINLNFTVNSLTNPQNNITTILHVGKELWAGLGYAGDTNIFNNHVLEDFDISSPPLNGIASKSIRGYWPYYPGDTITFVIAFTGQGNPTTIIDAYNNSVLQFNSATNGGVRIGTPGNYSVQWTNINGTTTHSVEATFTIIGGAGDYNNSATVTSTNEGYCSYEALSNVFSSVTGDLAISICGDGVVGSGEQCDMGIGNATGSACSVLCTLNTPSCSGVDFNPTAGSPGLVVTGTLPYQTGFIYNNLNWGEWAPIALSSGIVYHTYNSVWLFPISVEVSNILSGALTTSCTGQVQITNSPLNGICGAHNGQTFYTGSLPTLLCETPTVAVVHYDAINHTYSWTCEGANGGSNVSCQASGSYCGDGIVGTGIGYTTQEQCDMGTGNGNNGTCSASCQRVVPTCPADLSFTPSNGVVPLTVTGRWTLTTGALALQLNWQSGSVIPNPSSGASHVYSSTGIFNPVLTIANAINTGIQQNCAGVVVATDVPMQGICWSKNGTTVQNLSDESSWLCLDGQTVTGFVGYIFATGWGMYSWTCVAAWGNSPLCSATKSDENAWLPFNLSINKSITSAWPYYSGSTVNYRIEFYNDSEDDQVDVNIKDILPMGQQIIPGSFAYYDINVVNPVQTGGSPLERNINTLYSQQTGWITYSAKIIVNSGTQINTVTILPSTGTETIPYTGGTCVPWHNPLSGADYAVSGTDNTDCEQIVVSAWLANLVLTKTGSLTNYASGDIIYYTIDITNVGSVGQSNVVVSEILPTQLHGYTYIVSGPGPIYTGTTTSTWFDIMIANVNPGQHYTLQVSGMLLGSTTKINTAVITSGDCTICTGTWTTNPRTPNYDLTLDKNIVGGTHTFVVGQQVRFNIQVLNQSSVLTAHQFTIEDIIPNWLTLNDPNWTLSGNRAISTFNGTLVPGATYGKDINFTVNGSVLGNIINRAEITSDDGSDIDSTPHNWNGYDAEDDDDSDYINVITNSGPGWPYIPTPLPPCVGDSCYTIAPPTPPNPVVTTIKKIFTNIRDVIFPQAKHITPVVIPRTGADIEE